MCMTTNELLKKNNTKTVSGGEKYAYMVIKDTKWGKAGKLFFDFYENDDGVTVDHRDASGTTWATYTIGEEAVLVIRKRKQVITETYKLARTK